MPKIRTNRTRRPPQGFDDIVPTLDQFEEEMRRAENDDGVGKRKVQLTWEVLKLHHARTRYVYNLFYVRKVISRELYQWLVDEGYADALLMAKWKKAGYEKLCCLSCIQTRDHNFGTTCICRVPRAQLDSDRIVECAHCGCRGCASGDYLEEQRRKMREAIDAASSSAGPSSVEASVRGAVADVEALQSTLAAEDGAAQ
ncbi:G10 protein [Thecamonas trahens ATCC 50062]|uniref:G10 protein n=1 Tax=Thecamonas trahens ATCC 50062 TaxID=461836 RepID=A0A0L0DG13_THETB|nr:G10 protein [Thecamonas trahens ATCC 50062]KNC50283.1 G10 protein [Thecamonas trahens ATCC 50062]|eukprot:XP_013757110.1 G10 protein [Thecamonas trahens ATCC 50062]